MTDKCNKILFSILFSTYCFTTLAQKNQTYEDSNESPQNIRTVSFDITYNGFSAEAQTAFQFAADLWASILISEIPIKVNAYFTPLLPGVLGVTLPNGRKDFLNAPMNETWYATSLANAISESELNSGEFDMDLFLSSSIPWYFGTDGNCPLTKYDLVSTALHEICHGLGFVGLEKVQSGIGSFGLLQAGDFPLIVTSFPWPDLDTLPSIYDHFLENGDGVLLLNFDNPSTELAEEFTGNDIFWNGSNAVEYNNSVKPRIYAPVSFTLGSSMLHLDESTYPENSVNELMTPQAGPAVVKHDPGPVAIGILKDIGWNVNYSVGVEENEVEAIRIFPNPVRDFLHFSGFISEFRDLEIFDLTGRQILYLTDIPSEFDVTSFAPGTYLVEIETAKATFISKLIKL